MVTKKRLKWGDVSTLEYGKRIRDYHEKTSGYQVFGTNGPVGFYEKPLSKGPGVIIGRKGAYRGVHYSEQDFWVIDTAFYLKPKIKLNMKWAYYCLSLADINSLDSGSAIPSTSRDDFYQIDLNLPPLEEQNKIANILSQFDEKIEINKKLNQTLELIANTIFKEWFIDFGPVKAKSEGKKNYEMDINIEKLFANNFINSELGLIPEGWGVSSLAEFFEVKHGYAFKGEFFSEEPTENILVTPGNFKIGGGFKTDKLKYYNGPIPNDYILNEDDLMVTMTDLSKEGDTLGFPALVPNDPNLIFLHNQRIGLINLKNSEAKFWIYNLLQTPSYRSWILGSCTGSTVKHTSPSRILEHKTTCPPIELLISFGEVVKPLYEKIKSNEIEISALTKMRDLLIPKLISGEFELDNLKTNFEVH